MKDEYEVVIIGNSIDGLICGTLLSKNQKKVLIVGQGQPLGGYCHPIRSGELLFSLCNYSWDLSGGIMGLVLTELGLDGSVGFTKFDPIDTVIFPEHVFDRPADLRSYEYALLSEFAHEKEAIRFYFNEVIQLSEEWLRLVTSTEKSAIFKNKKMLKYYKTRYWEFIDKLFSDSKLKGILCVNLPYSDITLSGMAGYMVSQIFNAGKLTDGISMFTEKIAALFRQHGGEISDQIHVDRIGVRNGQVDGVRLKDGRYVKTRVIVSTSDYSFLQENLMPDVKRDGTDVNGTVKRVSPFSVIVRTSKAVNEDVFNDRWCCYYYPTYDVRGLYRKLENAEPVDEFPIRIYDLSIDLPQLAESDHLNFRIETDIACDLFPKNRESKVENRIADRLIDQVNRIIPGFKDEIKNRFVISPLYYEKQSHIRFGCMNRWALNVKETLADKLFSSSPVKGLYATGEWGGALFASAKQISNRILHE